MNSTIKEIDLIINIINKWIKIKYIFLLSIFLLCFAPSFSLYLLDECSKIVFIIVAFFMPLIITLIFQGIYNLYFLRIRNGGIYEKVIQQAKETLTKQEFSYITSYNFSTSILRAVGSVFFEGFSIIMLLELRKRAKVSGTKDKAIDLISSYSMMQIRRKILRRSLVAILFLFAIIYPFILIAFVHIDNLYFLILILVVLVPIPYFFIEKRLVSKFDFDKLQAELKSKNLDKVKVKKFLTLPYLKMDGHIFDKKTFKYLYGISDKNNDSL